MKKLLCILCIALCVVSLCACSKKEEEVEPELVGGWTEKEEELDEELIAMFEEATKDIVGVGYTPEKLLGTQVVAGTNYRFLCTAVTMDANQTTSYKVVTIYKDLQGGLEVTDISDYEE